MPEGGTADTVGRPRETVLAGQSGTQGRAGRRALRAARRRRHRHGHGRGHARARLRAVLHHQGSRRRHRARAADGQGVRRAVRRRLEHRQPPRPGHHRDAVAARGACRPASRRQGHRRPQAAYPAPACRRRNPGCCWSTTRTWFGKSSAAYLEQAGYSVLVAANGAEALALLAAGEAVDALVTDLSMPGMDGTCPHPRRAAAHARSAGSAADRLCRRLRPPSRRSEAGGAFRCCASRWAARNWSIAFACC